MPPKPPDTSWRPLHFQTLEPCNAKIYHFRFHMGYPRTSFNTLANAHEPQREGGKEEGKREEGRKWGREERRKGEREEGKKGGREERRKGEREEGVHHACKSFSVTQELQWQGLLKCKGEVGQSERIVVIVIRVLFFEQPYLYKSMIV